MGSGTWTDYDVDVVRERSLTQRIADGSPTLWGRGEAVFVDAFESVASGAGQEAQMAALTARVQSVSVLGP